MLHSRKRSMQRRLLNGSDLCRRTQRLLCHFVRASLDTPSSPTQLADSYGGVHGHFRLLEACFEMSRHPGNLRHSPASQAEDKTNDEGSAVELLRGRIRDAFDILNHRKLIALVDKSAVRFTCSKFLCLALEAAELLSNSRRLRVWRGHLCIHRLSVGA